MPFFYLPDDLSTASAAKAPPRAEDFADALLVGFDGMRDAGSSEPTRWDAEIARRFAGAVFGGGRRVAGATAYERVRGLAEEGRFDFAFCRRVAYYLVCVEIADEQCRETGVAERPSHFWDSPSRMEPWAEPDRVPR